MLQHQVKNRKLGLWVLLGIIGLIVVGGSIVSAYYSSRLDRDGVYILGKVTKWERAKNGTHYEIVYVFNDVSYSSGFLATGSILDIGSKIFIRIVPENPKIHELLYRTRVPDCLTLSKVPTGGWRALPADSCK